MKYFKFIAVGMLFGIVMIKSQAVSWYRIYEMFRFESFHMYGIIGSAVAIGALLTFIIKRQQLKTIGGSPITFYPKQMSITRYLAGGTIFGLGWALTGACPGPMFVLLGYGILTMLLVIVGAVAGTFVYGLFRSKLPH